MGMGVAVGGSGVLVAGSGVGDARIVGKFDVPPEQAVNINNKRIQVRFSVSIPPIIPERVQLCAGFVFRLRV